MTNSIPTPLVHFNNGQITTTSISIAQHFGKHHKDILKAIKKLDCSADFRRRNFAPSYYKSEQGKSMPAYQITRDGFMFLCMGFTGKAAARWKEAYIRAFNQLEAEVIQQRVEQTLDYLELPTFVRQELLNARPRWKHIKRYSDMGLNNSEMSKLLGISPRTLAKHKRTMERCGLIEAPQQLALFQAQAVKMRKGLSHE